MKSFIAASVFLLVALTAAQGCADDEGPRTAFYPSDIVYSGTGQPVVFSHSFHVDGLGYACDACHTEIFELEAYAAKDRGDFKMSVMQDGDYCGKCHDGETAFSAGDFMYCGRCHTGAGGSDVQPGLKVIGPQVDIMLGQEGAEAVFRHTSHSGFKCGTCHTGLFPMKDTGTVTGMDEINAGKSCGTCHNGQAAFDASECSACHPGM